jgi:glutaminyl-peptide cyclotransferase
MLEKVLPQGCSAEGLTAHDNYLYLSTRFSMVLFILDAHTLELVGERSFLMHNGGVGWGLATDGKYLIASDCSDRIHYFELPLPNSFRSNFPLVQIKQITVHDLLTKITELRIKELEYANGHIYANIWHRDVIGESLLFVCLFSYVLVFDSV